MGSELTQEREIEDFSKSIRGDVQYLFTQLRSSVSGIFAQLFKFPQKATLRVIQAWNPIYYSMVKRCDKAQQSA
jgi:hypothetical protein